MDTSSRRIMRLVPVFTLDEFNSRRKKCLPKFVPDELCDSSIKKAIDMKRVHYFYQRNVAVKMLSVELLFSKETAYYLGPRGNSKSLIIC